MGHWDDLATLDATAQAELVRRKQITPAELVEAAIERMERVNPTINAISTMLIIVSASLLAIASRLARITIEI